MTIAADLAALGIDSPEMRWLAVRDYLIELERPAIKAENAIWLAAEFLDLCETNAANRLHGPFRAFHAVDYLTARATILGRYKGQTRARAREVLDRYSPPDLRKDASLGRA